MSLRTRVVILIGLVLLAGVLVGSAFAGFEARRALAAELSAGLTGGDQTVESAFEDLPRSIHPERDLRQLVATFDGNRHVRAALIGPDASVVAASRVTHPSKQVPNWFARLLGPEPAPVSIAVPAGVSGFRAIRLEPTSGLDVSALWAEFSIVVVVLSGAAMGGLLLVYFAIGAALRPLRELSEAFVRIGAGDYAGRVIVNGPSELTRLELGFNTMAEKLSAMDSRNRMLETQLLTLQDEERADIARDLHDEIGPHLFAVNVDAEVIARLVLAKRTEEIPDQVRSIQAGVGHMQRLVREILTRLRPTRATEFGLNAALADLISFWQSRSPNVVFDMSLLQDEAILTETQKDTVYRVVQEGVNNAIRHAQPDQITVSVQIEAYQLLIEVGDDGEQRPTRAGTGLGLIGMRERVRASGGILSIDRRDKREGGWRIQARLPLGQGRSPMPNETRPA